MKTMIQQTPIQVRNETDPLRAVIVGIAQDRPALPHPNNPKIVEQLSRSNIPTEAELIKQVNGFAAALEEKGIKVLRPENLPNQDQIFTRDIGFVIEDTFIRAGLQKENRRVEFDAIRNYVAQFEKVVEVPKGAFIEGGDVILWNDYIFVGISERTNPKGADFLKEQFPQKKVITLPLVVSDDVYKNILHLDCTFQPFGDRGLIIYEAGFQKSPTEVIELFDPNKIIRVTPQEMYDMVPNIFSISPKEVIVEEKFTRLRQELEGLGIQTTSVPYEKVSRLGGLLRCSTLPVYREY